MMIICYGDAGDENYNDLGSVTWHALLDLTSLGLKPGAALAEAQL